MNGAADVVVIGAGPAGLSAATALARRGAGRIVVLERERVAGGIPRHADHAGFGLRDLRRSLSGPEYARRLVTRATDAGALIYPRTQVTGWGEDGALELTGPAGRTTLRAGAVVLATGCRERPRSARLIPGDRPLGAVMTTGQLQQLVHLDGVRLDGRRAVVVGAEHVSFSALQTLEDAGAQPIAMTTEFHNHQSFAAFAAGARLRYRLPLHTRTAIGSIDGLRRVESVTVVALGSGREQRIACDLVILTADWIPDHELAVLAGARLDPGTRGPAVDGAGRTTRPGLFAAGNVLHGAETADIAALGGAALTGAVSSHLAGAPWRSPVPIVCAAPLQWLVPERGRCRLRAQEHLRDVRLEVRQDGRRLARARLPRVLPGRSVTLPGAWLDRVDPAGAEVVVRAISARRRSSGGRCGTMPPDADALR